MGIALIYLWLQFVPFFISMVRVLDRFSVYSLRSINFLRRCHVSGNFSSKILSNCLLDKETENEIPCMKWGICCFCFYFESFRFLTYMIHKKVLDEHILWVLKPMHRLHTQYTCLFRIHLLILWFVCLFIFFFYLGCFSRII